MSLLGTQTRLKTSQLGMAGAIGDKAMSPVWTTLIFGWVIKVRVRQVVVMVKVRASG